MTGIGRLRTLAGAWDAYGLGGALGDVARQIERERACDEDAIENVRLIVGGVIDDMERHVLGHEGMEDSPVARWARELREALGGEGRDLLPNEDREAIAWVREHGGLGAVKDEWNNRRTVKQQLENAQSKVERQQRHIESIQSKLAERRDRIADLECERDELRTQVDAMRPRLMPEGMEWLVDAWPRFEDDAPVRFGDEWCLVTGGTAIVGSVTLRDDSFALNASWYDMGERVKRPAPKVLDADGAEIRVGDTVWFIDESLEDFGPHIVSDVKNDPGMLKTETVKFEDCAFPYPASSVTHRAPVLAADGKPLREGETVYLTDSPTAFVIDDIMTREDGATVVHLKDGAWHRPQDLTHERPDSWERLWMDMHPADETECVGLNLDEFERRAKVLAERRQ